MRKIKSTNKRIGTCKICGDNGKLTFEHVPPKSAFNNFHQLEYSIHEGHKLLSKGKGRYKTLQKGTGGHYLCTKCNNNTGAMYVKSFAEWSSQIASVVYTDSIEKGILKEHDFNFYPLRVIKQIVAMFLCINHQSWHENSGIRKKLVEFVSSPYINSFPDGLRIYFYGHSPFSTFARRIQSTIIADPIKYGEELFASEISMLGAGYIITEEANINSLNFLDIPYFIDITFFKSYSYDELESLKLEIPVLPNNTMILGDYREKKDIKEIMPENQLILLNDNTVKGVTVKK